MPSAVPINFPKEISTAVSGLPERMFLTPTFLSALAMGPVLPKQFEKFIKKEDFYPLAQENLREVLFQRSSKFWLNLDIDLDESDRVLFDERYEKLNATHSMHVTTEDGIERLELRAKQPTSRYVICYPGNCQDAMLINCIEEQVNNERFKNSNHIFWNYPGIETASTYSLSVYDIIVPGLKQVQILLEKDISAHEIALNARSLGGGIATQVIKRLRSTDYRPNLFVDRSFSSDWHLL